MSIDVELVTRLIAAQHPSLLQPVSWLSSGWDNELFRLGDDYVVRMPRRALAVPLIEHEQRWLPELQKLVEVPIPVPVALGVPSDDYAWPWSIARWLPGEPVAHLPIAERGGLVGPLARFLLRLHVPAPADAPVNPVRGVPLVTRDAAVRGRLVATGHEGLLPLWARAVAAPAFDGPALWLHGDLHPLNVLAASGSVSAVIDFGDLTGGDPATDLAAAWLFFDAEQRAGFRALLAHDDATWQRARGWAVGHASAFLQSSDDAPALAAVGRHAIEQLVGEL